MRLHRAPTVTALLLAATLTLAACSDDEPREPEPSPSSAGTTAAPTPSLSAEPTEPVLPEAAKKPTEAGARAFITYYWDLINYAQVTGDVKALKKVSGPNCEGCEAGIRAVENHYSSGGEIQGGEYTANVIKINELSGQDPNASAYEAKLALRNQAQRVVNGDGTARSEPPGESFAVVAAFWALNTWRLEAMEIR